VLVNSTPHEVWFGKNPSFSHLIVFGYDAFAHVPKEKRNKLNNKAIKCIFLNYKDGMKGYKLWDLVLRKTMYGQDVIFREFGGISRTKEAQMEK
jgi:hypothetical protein